ncbi:MAG: permease [Chloroflexota bacterium]
MKRVKRSLVIELSLLAGYLLFVGISLLLDFTPGKAIGGNFWSAALGMLKILPGAFVLIALFEVWVKRETVEKHLGEGSGARGYFWAILLAGTTVGAIYVVFPVAQTLYAKGAKFSVILTYVSAAAICRIPMSVFEASFLGLEFTIIRLAVSIPLVILTSTLLGRYLTRSGYRLNAPRES